ncbi:MAG: hypothetical protein HC938_16430 [Nitrospira sp.]|nr:hypothetical protein [Nitrospira sp.]
MERLNLTDEMVMGEKYFFPPSSSVDRFFDLSGHVAVVDDDWWNNIQINIVAVHLHYQSAIVTPSFIPRLTLLHYYTDIVHKRSEVKNVKKVSIFCTLFHLKQGTEHPFQQRLLQLGAHGTARL